jgi:transcriptional regulator with XRE-family HTH domain
VAEPPATLAVLLRKLRSDAGLTQEELAEAAGLSPRSVSDLERGVNKTARKDTARLLADALNLSGPASEEFQAVARGRTPASGHLPGGAADVGVAAASRTLPRDIASFTGREPEFRELVGAASTVGPIGLIGIHAIGGMAGIGKTAFAVHVAHQRK